MSAGIQPTQQIVNQALTTCAIQMRNLMQQVADLNLSVASLGTAGLEAIGFTAADAAEVISQAAILNTVAAVYAGTATQATLYDFNNALAGLWAAQ